MVFSTNKITEFIVISQALFSASLAIFCLNISEYIQFFPKNKIILIKYKVFWRYSKYSNNYNKKNFLAAVTKSKERKKKRKDVKK